MRHFLSLTVVTLLMTSALPADAATQASQTPLKAPWGKTSDGPVEIFTLTNAHGVEARIISYGATLVSLKAPDRTGRLENIVLGFDNVEAYVMNTPHYGGTIGRYANRIAKARFSLDGKTYQLAANNAPNTLHGGNRGFDKRLWKAEVLPASDGNGVRFTYVSPAGEEGFPGELTTHVVYRLDDKDNLEIDYSATTNAPTPINLTNHAYFNLAADPTASVLDDVLTVNADRFTPVDETLIPTGELKAVAGTPFDFRKPQRIGDRIGSPDEQLRRGQGYDHNYVINRASAGVILAAVATDPRNGRSLEVWTTQPGIQVYTGNAMDGKPLAGGGSQYGRRTGLCLETQHFPDSPNQSGFPSTILRPGKTFSERTVFSVRVVK